MDTNIVLFCFATIAAFNLMIAVTVSIGLRTLFAERKRVLPFTQEELAECIEEIHNATGVPANHRDVEAGPKTACDALVRCRLMLGSLVEVK